VVNTLTLDVTTCTVWIAEKKIHRCPTSESYY